MNIFAFVVSFLLFVGGIVLMGYAFDVEGLGMLMFAGGIAAVCVSVAIPAHVLKRIDS